MKKIDVIRNEEKKYHDEFYENNILFKEGSWLHKPVQVVLDMLPYFDDKQNVTLLDLGCGIGRNSIPLAKAIKANRGKVVCVDLLDSALSGLREYSEKYNVEKVIQRVKADISDYSIEANQYDGIVVVSALEHVKSEEVFDKVLNEMMNGTKSGGINCLIVNTEIEELDVETKKELDVQFEVNISTEAMLAKLNQVYVGWEIIKQEMKQIEFSIDRNNKAVLLKTNAITYVVRKATEKAVI